MIAAILALLSVIPATIAHETTSNRLQLQDDSTVAPDGSWEHASDHIDLVLDESILEEIADLLTLSDAQRRFARAQYAAYRAALKDIASSATRLDELDEKVSAVDSKIRESPDDAFHLQEESDTLTLEWLRVRAEMNRRAVHAVRAWISSLTEVLGEEQTEALIRAERHIRRRNLLKPAGERTADFHRPVDLFDVVRLAKERCAELSNVLDEDIESILIEYEEQIDTILRAQVEASCRAPSRIEPPISWLDPERREAQRLRTRSQRAISKLDVVLHASRRIASLFVEPTALDARRQWERRVWYAIAPGIVKPMWADNLPEWIADRPDLIPEQVSAADDWAAQYQASLHLRHRAAIDAGLAAMRLHGTVWGPERAHGRYIRALDDIVDAHERAIAHFRSLLIDAQRRDFDKEIVHARLQRRGEFSVFVPPAIGELHRSRDR